MSLTQANLDRMAKQATGVLGSLTETVTYAHKATQDATAANHTIDPVRFNRFRKSEIDLEQVLPTDQRMRIAVSSLANLSITPTRFDEVTREDSSQWAVMDISGGPGHVFWTFQLRQIG